MSNNPFSVATATGDEIIPIVEKIQYAVDGESFPAATMSLLYTVFVMAYPEISNKDLQFGIKSASEHICLLLDSFEHPIEGDDAKLKMN